MTDQPPIRCIVAGCSNRSNQGQFVGELCRPCYIAVTTGQVGPTQAFFGRMYYDNEKLEALKLLVLKFLAASAEHTRKRALDELRRSVLGPGA